MRLLLALIIIVYLVGVGVALSPTIRSEWSPSPASELARNIAQELPGAPLGQQGWSGVSRPPPSELHFSTIATARVHPAEACAIFTGKHETVKPVAGSSSRLPSFSRWQ